MYLSLYGTSSRTSSACRTLFPWYSSCMRFRLRYSFSNAYTRESIGGCLARLFLLCLALHLGRPSVHSFAFERHEGKSFVFLSRETTFYVPMACHGASCASFFCSLRLIFICHPNVFVIQSVAKDLEYINVDAPEIFRTESSTTRLRHYVPLNDRNA